MKSWTNLIHRAAIGIGYLSMLAVFQNCSNAQFAIKSGKQNLLSTQSVFQSSDTPGAVEGQIVQPGGSGPVSGTVGQPSSGGSSSGTIPSGTTTSGGSTAGSGSTPGSNPGGSSPSSGGAGPTTAGSGSTGTIGQPTPSGAGGSLPSFPTDTEIGDSTASIPAPTVANGKFPVIGVCMAEASAKGAQPAKTLELIVTDSQSGKVVCDLTQGVRESVVNNRVIDFSACNLPGNSYSMKLVDPSLATQDLFFSVPESDSILQDTDISLKRTSASAAWKLTTNVSTSQPGFTMTANEAKWASGSTGVGVLMRVVKAALNGSSPSTGCDYINADPLMIDMTPANQHSAGLSMTSQAMGVLFDILGLNATPFPYAKQKISWPQNHNYMFLALPDKNGSVRGIDQLFGNNTMGPDRRFARDGFAALSKFDSNHDAVIDRRDDVFAALRLWSDANGDGIAQTNELHSLAEFGVIEIDLKYDASYRERDAYGNESKYKSVVKTKDGALHMIFDLWFAIER